MSETTEQPRWRRIAKAILPVNWRAIVAWAAMASVAYPVNCLLRKHDIDPIPIPPPPAPLWPDGWIHPSDTDTAETLAVLRQASGEAVFADTAASQVDMVGDDTEVFLWRAAIKARGAIIPSRNQGQVGSCVSFGFGSAVEHALCVERARGARVDCPDIAQEAIYAASRVEIHPGKRRTIQGDGSTGAWAAKALTTVGVLPRQQYGSHDLRVYSVPRCREWGDNGIPDELEPEAAKRLVSRCVLVTTVEEARKSIRQGYPVAVCSSIGFGSRQIADGGQQVVGAPMAMRDADGYLSRQGQWMHCMVFVGSRAGGLLCLNSWGPDWVGGGKYPLDQPEGSFWVRDQDVQAMLSQRDSYAVAGPQGFRRRKIVVDDWIVSRPLGGQDRAYVDRLGVDLFGFLRR